MDVAHDYPCNDPDTRAVPQPAYNHGHDHYRGNGWMVLAGVIVLGGNVMVRLMMIPAYPFRSLTVFTLDILAIYGLIAYGKKISSLEL